MSRTPSPRRFVEWDIAVARLRRQTEAEPAPRDLDDVRPSLDAARRAIGEARAAMSTEPTPGAPS